MMPRSPIPPPKRDWTWRRAAVALLLAAPLAAQFEEPAPMEWAEPVATPGARVVVSYQENPNGVTLMRTQAVASGVELVVRLAGWSVWRAPAGSLPPTAFPPDDAAAWQAAFGESLAVEVEWRGEGAGGLVVTPYPSPYTEAGLLAWRDETWPGWKQTAPGPQGLGGEWQGEALDDPWPALAAWAGAPDDWVDRFRWPDAAGVPDWVVDEETINLGWVRRWQELSAAQRAAFGDLDEGGVSAAEAVVRWTRLALVHGVFNARLQPEEAAAWLGRAWLGASLVAAANPDSIPAQEVVAEWRALLRRFSGKVWGDVPVSRHLPELRMVLAYERTPFDARAPFPRIAGPFDYLIRIESYQTDAREPEERLRFLREGGMEALDRLLLGFKDAGRAFESNQEIYNLSAQLYRQSRLTLVNYALGQLHDVLAPEPEAVAEDFIVGLDPPMLAVEEAWQGDGSTEAADLWGALDQEGVKGYRGEAAPPVREQVLALQLGALRRVETVLESGAAAFDDDWALSWADAWPEVRGWLLRLTWAWRGRLNNLGADSGVAEADRLWTRAGFALAAPLPGFDLLRPNTQWQDGYEAQWRDVRRAFYTGAHEEAAERVQPLLAVTMENRNDLLLAAQIGFAAGRRDEFLRKVAGVYRSGFGKDNMKQWILSLCAEPPADLADFVWPKNTASANDYLARAEWAMRAEDWAGVLEICETYHYGESERIGLLRRLAWWWSEGQLSPEDLNAVRGALVSEFEMRLGSSLDTFDQWYAQFERRFGDDPAWRQLKIDTQFEAVAAVSAARKRLRGPMDEAELAATRAEMRALSRDFTPERFTRLWQLGALEAEQEACGRWLVAFTRQFTVRLDEAEEAVLDVVRHTRAVRHERVALNEEAMPYPLAGAWLRAAVWAGADRAALARWVAGLRTTDVVLGSEGALLAAAVGDAAILAELWERLPYGETRLRPRFPAMKVTPALLETVARDLGRGDLVAWAALGAWVDEAEFAPLARVLASAPEDEVRDWMERNAPDQARLREWTRAVADGRTATEGAPAGRTTVPPDLTEYLTRAADLADAR